MASENQNFHSEKYKLIPRVLVFAMRGEKLLLLKGSAHKKIWPNLYNGIGGHIEQGENIFSAAKREFFEETGLALIDPHLCAIITIDTGESTGIGLFVYQGNAGSGKTVPSKEGTLKWVSPKEITKLPLVEDLEILIPKIFSAEHYNQILYGQYIYNEEGKLDIKFEEGQ